MENYVSAQLGALGTAVALGAAGGFIYDLLRAARLIDRRDHRLTHLLDGLFAVLLGGGILWLALVVGGGELRLYMTAGILLGAALWFCLPSRLLRPVWDFWTAALVAAGRILWIPFAYLGRQVKKLTAAIKKCFSFLVKWVTIRSGRRHSHRPPTEPQQKGGSVMARGTKRRRTAGRPGTMILLVLITLAAVLGVQIVRVYSQLADARAAESTLNQQLTQQQQENDALRSDLSKKDDESFIKALARDLLGLAEDGERIFYDVND